MLLLCACRRPRRGGAPRSAAIFSASTSFQTIVAAERQLCTMRDRPVTARPLATPVIVLGERYEPRLATLVVTAPAPLTPALVAAAPPAPPAVVDASAASAAASAAISYRYPAANKQPALASSTSTQST
jgi:hypothetical protein